MDGKPVTTDALARISGIGRKGAFLERMRIVADVLPTTDSRSNVVLDDSVINQRIAARCELPVPGSAAVVSLAAPWARRKLHYNRR